MNYNPIKSTVLTLMILVTGGVSEVMAKAKAARENKILPAPAAAQASQDPKNSEYYDDCDSCGDTLNLANLCAKHIKVKCIDARKVNSREVCAEKLKAQDACIQRLNVDEICAHGFNTTGGGVNTGGAINGASVSAPLINAGSINTGDLCVQGTARINNLEACGQYRATVVFAADNTYTLGDPVNFDTVLDDPNGNVSTGPFSYTAPVSGYYIFTIQIDSFNLQPASGNPILGIPVSNPEILVNGALYRQSFSPYLAFLNKQNTTFSALIRLKAGDQVSVRFNVFVMDQSVGVIPVTGTIVLDGNGQSANRSLFKIHYLSSDCLELPCPSFQESFVECSACDVQCEPCCTTHHMHWRN